MKYRALTRLFEAGHHYQVGDVLDLTSERAQQLGGKVEYAGELPMLNSLDPITTEMESPAKDTSMKRKGRKPRL